MSTKPGMALQIPVESPFLEQMAGAGKGKIFEIGSNQITIGRAKENDIIVQSEAVSRLHARILESEGAWFIRDNGSKNGIQVNGQTVRESWLSNGDIVQVGDFVFRFNAPVPVGAEAPAMEEPAVAEPFVAPMAAPQSDIPLGIPTAAPKKKPNRRLLIYGVILLFGAWFYLSSPTEDTGEKTDGKPTLARDFKESDKPDLSNDPGLKPLAGIEDPLLKEAEQEMLGLDWTNSSLRQSEQFFKKGQREYLAKNYHRSIEYLQTALQLFKGHRLADRYLKRAVFEAELEAKNQMALAIQYYTTLQYQRAIYHFSEVITLMAHRPTEPIVVEAGRYIEQSKKRLKAAELFP